MQQDAHEFLNYLLNTIGDLLQSKPKKLFVRSMIMFSTFLCSVSVSCNCCFVEILGEKQKEKEKLVRHGSVSSTASSRSNGTISSSMASSSNVPQSHEETWIHELFEGTLTNETRCLSCETVCKIKYNIFSKSTIS